MTTAFALLCQRCGLSHREAADFLKVRPDTVKSWSAGRNRTPDNVIDELRALYARIERSADEALAEIGRSPDNIEFAVIELGLARTDAEAHKLGWPCVGAQAAALGLIAARSDKPVAVVTRGATTATWLAARRHDAAG